jgi:acyl-CoA hydrolase
MEIRIQCSGEGHNEWIEAYFTFVATDPETKRPVKISSLQPETDAELAQFYKRKKIICK